MKIVRQHLNTYGRDLGLCNAKPTLVKFPSLFHQNKFISIVFRILNKCKHGT